MWRICQRSCSISLVSLGKASLLPSTSMDGNLKIWYYIHRYHCQFANVNGSRLISEHIFTIAIPQTHNKNLTWKFANNIFPSSTVKSDIYINVLLPSISSDFYINAHLCFSCIGCGLIQAQYAFHNISNKSYITVKYFGKMMRYCSTTPQYIKFSSCLKKRNFYTCLCTPITLFQFHL